MEKQSKEIEIKIVYPSTREGWVRLQDRIDEMYAKIIIWNIEKLNCSTEQKLTLLEEVKAEINNRAKEERKMGIEAWKTNIHLAKIQ